LIRSRLLETGAHCNHIAENKPPLLASRTAITGDFDE
jgi:hypothetical protein